MKQALGQSGATTDQKLQRAGVILQSDESIVAMSVVHPAIYWKGVAVVLFGLCLTPTFLSTVGLFLMFVGALMLGMAYMTRRFLILVATDKRLIIRSGLLYADMIEMRYAQVESVELGMTPIGQFFGYGNVIVTGTGQRRFIVPFVTEAFDFRYRVNDILVNK